MPTTTDTIRIVGGWAIDHRANRASIEFFGSEQAARDALASLKDCTNCTNCARCADCARCANCTNCADCAYCTDCTNCARCANCTNCTNCAYCTDCTNCANCTNCADCAGCADCTNCADCADCDDCGGHFDALPAPGALAIHDMDRAVYAAVSAPGALDMSCWHHSCGTAHCWAGWIVTLAGDVGRKLEGKTSTAFAAMQIAKASGAPISPTWFHVDNAAALAEMKRRAEAAPSPAAA